MASCSMQKAAQHEIPWAACLANYDCQTPWSASSWYNTQRGRLVFLSQFLERVDARWTGISQAMEPSLWLYFEELNLTAPYMSMEEQMMYRYALNVDGTGSADRIYLQLLGGSVVLIPESPFVAWLVGDSEGAEQAALRPFEHFVPLRYDLSDLPARLEWLEGEGEGAGQR
eukprot:CAMPEP_0203933786 /NCGR_PEP_ID=MMETSP0359-20131031/71900_1 /ASSEMBLY_ACC=CAM_ASM_000338 /TAXON_ID=268821 /ORGANISM="Scrippsiella Hangoei, Strain SHTV-5" /LENGTH=170 /DNA_ID=CAMNT_0050863413 /DNA_START=42 /DNA_END=550 /DNA_ORIENTATION=-